ncbi:MAG: exodeoxyribonuclease VII small subunit [Clostridiales Family XIII bacterium]|jgi:exodeoxyribonuclease VII small subunit|nr:exodeoxyribonuclease VII small subunit [Clostridiales Family XIII bacterium]
MTQKTELTFEQAMDKLLSASEKLSKKDVPLEKAIATYKEGIGYYDLCVKILNEAEQTIEQIGKNVEGKEIEND